MNAFADMSPFAGMGMTDAELLSDEAPMPDHTAQSSRKWLSGFGPGVMIETAEGPQPVEWLRSGDLLLTRDQGYQPLLWAGRSALNETNVTNPVRIFAGALGERTPERDLILSPDHHILLSAPQIEVYFAESEVFVPVSDVATEAEIAFAIPNPQYAYCHLLMKEHEVLLAEGIWIESLFPDEDTLSMLPPKSADHVRAMLGPNHHSIVSARLMLHRGEALVLEPRSVIAARRMAA
ncbi:Hint domain-containing protein [Celeribacter baekdonensis]|uniref:Hint domain-containing protein n=1 Tax=Celeribacter baekdonensis TaxID=875171 RepID=UPI0030DA55C6|tara:strand:+ start:211269 stop:211976 length:708 start_codon:yes stop_codon:yes gene_type:complete